MLQRLTQPILQRCVYTGDIRCSTVDFRSMLEVPVSSSKQACLLTHRNSSSDSRLILGDPAISMGTDCNRSAMSMQHEPWLMPKLDPKVQSTLAFVEADAYMTKLWTPYFWCTDRAGSQDQQCGCIHSVLTGGCLSQSTAADGRPTQHAPLLC